MNPGEKENWMKEFAEFEQSTSEVPAGLLLNIQTRLFPNPWRVFAKIAGLHMIVGFLSLAICNQFGLNPFNTRHSLADFFMRTAGHNACMIGCGIIFVSLTYLLANIFLTLEELESIRKHEWLQIGILSMGSIAGFHFLGAELVGTFVALWFVGALIGGLLSIEASFRLRRQLV
jgi:hypothetical protein